MNNFTKITFKHKKKLQATLNIFRKGMTTETGQKKKHLKSMDETLSGHLLGTFLHRQGYAASRGHPCPSLSEVSSH